MKMLRKITAAAAVLVITLSGITGSTAVYAYESGFLTEGGWYETAYAVWEDSAAAYAEVSYKSVDDEEYTLISGDDTALIRQIDPETARVDIPGLGAGKYDIKVVASNRKTLETRVTVLAEDRSGYAHFNRPTESRADDASYDGVGAYKDDGTPKEGADIIYVTNENKNTIEYSGYRGIGVILSNAKFLHKPLIVRFIGKIDSSVWVLDPETKTITENCDEGEPIKGLYNRFYILSEDVNKYTVNAESTWQFDKVEDANDTDTYISMLDIKSNKVLGYTGFSNITLEGVGTDAEFVNWGVLFRYCSSIEVKNITFTNYQEDGCTAQNANRVWFHRCTFNMGKNLCDLTDEQDKGDGDGSSDVNVCENVTISYCTYNGTHKTSLSGNGDSTKQYNYTYHHNFYNGCRARLPLARYVNVHTYNNYVKGTTETSISARASAFVFSEGNYYEDNNTVFESKSGSKGNGIVKSYNDIITTDIESDGFINMVSDRNETLDIAAVDGETNQHLSEKLSEGGYINNFDTNPDYFYYADGASAVSYLTDAEKAKTDAENYSGSLKDNVEYIAVA
ncbi:MAG: hypothetical protein LUG24_02450 [Clostridiales bacterium]|nr:hypothetical protein [Clostridiales bacterium]